MTAQQSNSVLIICTSHADLGETGNKTGFWFEELAAPYNILKDAGYRPVIALPKGGRPPLDEGSNSSDFRTDDVVKFEGNPAAMAELEESIALSDVADLSEFAGVFLVGGHGTMWDFSDNQELKRILTGMADAGKTIAGVCHGVAGLLAVPELIRGKKVTGFSNAEEGAVGLTQVVPFLLEDKLKEAGAEYSCGDVFAPNVVVDGNLVTGQNPGSSALTAHKMLTRF